MQLTKKIRVLTCSFPEDRLVSIVAKTELICFTHSEITTRSGDGSDISFYLEDRVRRL